jgi:mRNA-degrading endonuclease RelE of RelBE toxin-antitoxin system
MRFVETTFFTRQIRMLLEDDEYRGLQAELVLRPRSGAFIPGSGGLRRIRWGARSRGKLGGIRVVYYWHEAEESFFMLFAYPKSVQDNLSPGELRRLRRIVREEFE